RLAVVRGDGRLEQHAAIAREDLADPAAPDDGIAAAHEEAIAFDAGLVEVVAAAGEVEVAQEQLVAAIVDVVKRRPVALGRVLGSEDGDVRGELDLALGVARRLVEIDDDLVVGIRGIDGEMGDGRDFLIRARVAERLAAGKGLALENLELDHFSTGPCRTQEERPNNKGNTHRFHRSLSEKGESDRKRDCNARPRCGQKLFLALLVALRRPQGSASRRGLRSWLRRFKNRQRLMLTVPRADRALPRGGVLRFWPVPRG